MPEMTDTDLLAEFERLAAAATPGEWAAVSIFGRAGRAYVDGPRFGELIFSKGTSLSHGGHAKKADADFTAFARNNAARLIELGKRAETLQQEIDEAKVIADWSGSLRHLANECGRARMNEAALEAEIERLTQWRTAAAESGEAARNAELSAAREDQP